MLDELKKQVCQANLELVTRRLVEGTFGNVSGIDRAAGCVVIKPSGVPYAELKPKQMAVVSYETGTVVEGDLRPSSDTPTHLVLYRAFPGVGGIAHTHSLYATAWAQAGKAVPVLGTTHADEFPGPIPCTRPMTPEEIETGYEANTGNVIVERLVELDPEECPGVLVASHGPFAWGADCGRAAHNAAVVEQLARLASETLRIEPYPRPMQKELIEKHFRRKHGPGRTYGQESSG